MSEILILSLGSGNAEATRELVGAARRIMADGDTLEILEIAEAHPGLHDDLVRQILSRPGPVGHVFLTQETVARDLGPRLALALGGGYVSGAVGISVDADGAVTWLRPVMAHERIQPLAPLPGRPVVVSLAPGAFPADEGPLPSIQKISVQCAPGIRCQSLPGRGRGDAALLEARVVVAVGRGMGDVENIQLAREMVAAIPGAALAASRPLVDAGLIPYAHQVGLTGNRVAPELYLALGISGAPQHLGGMAGSRTIVAVNVSPSAPIFRHARICIQADAPAFVRAFLAGEAKLPV